MRLYFSEVIFLPTEFGDGVENRRIFDVLMNGQPLLSSFEPVSLDAARAAAPGLERGYLTDRLAPGWDETARALGCVSVHCNSRYLTEAQADEVRSAGYWLASQFGQRRP